jgi:GT2 family glycosyltransferase
MKVFIATPCYGGMCSEGYLRGILQTVVESQKNNVSIVFSTIGNDSLITRARNRLLAEFLKTDAEYLFFIDSDMHFSSNDFFSIINSNKDVVVGACPVKGINFKNFINKKIEQEIEAKFLALEYALDFSKDKGNKLLTEDGLNELKNAGTAFMCIKRSAIEHIIREGNNLKYTDSTDGSENYALFDTMIDDDGTYLSEDYAFCRRYQKVGGKVFLNPKVAISHFGSYLFEAVPIN